MGEDRDENDFGVEKNEKEGDGDNSFRKLEEILLDESENVGYDRGFKDDDKDEDNLHIGIPRDIKEEMRETKDKTDMPFWKQFCHAYCFWKENSNSVAWRHTEAMKLYHDAVNLSKAINETRKMGEELLRKIQGMLYGMERCLDNGKIRSAREHSKQVGNLIRNYEELYETNLVESLQVRYDNLERRMNNFTQDKSDDDSNDCGDDGCVDLENDTV